MEEPLRGPEHGNGQLLAGIASMGEAASNVAAVEASPNNLSFLACDRFSTRSTGRLPREPAYAGGCVSSFIGG